MFCKIIIVIDIQDIYIILLDKYISLNTEHKTKPRLNSYFYSSLELKLYYYFRFIRSLCIYNDNNNTLYQITYKGTVHLCVFM